MNTKEAIKIVKMYKSTLDNDICNKENEELDDIIELLQRGEKFEAIYDNLKQNYGYTFYFKADVHNVFLYDVLNNLKQKYFPKPKDKTIELITQINKEVKELLEMIEKGGK